MKKLLALLLLFGSVAVYSATDKTLNSHIVCFYEQLTNGTNKQCFQSPDSVTGDVNFTLPDGDGNSGQAILTDGAGALSWGDAGGGGGTGVNFIVDSNEADSSTGEATVGSWVAYDDGAVSGPVDGTGGSPAGVSCDRTTSVGEVLDGDASIELHKIGADYQGEGCSIDFKIPIGYRNSRLSVKTLLMTDDVGYSSGDGALFLYNVDSAVFVDLEGELNGDDGKDLPADIAGNSFNYFYFTPSNDTDDDYRLIFHITETGTSGYDIGWDNISVGPAEVNSGVPVRNFVNYSPAYANDTGLTLSSSTFSYDQNGPKMTLKGDIVVSGTGSDASLFTFSLPSGRAIDDSIIGSSAVLGNGQAILEGSPDTNDPITIEAASTTTLFINLNDGSSGEGGLEGDDLGGGSGLYRRIKFDINFPIAEWAGSANFATSQDEYACTDGTWDADDTSTTFTTNGCAMGGTLATARTKTITWQSLNKYDLVVVEASDDQVHWAPINGSIVNSIPIIPSLTSSGTLTNRAGVSWESGSSSNQTDVVFGRYINVANDDAPATEWPSSNAYWRVRKISNGKLGAEIASENRAGLVNPYTEGSGVVYGGTYTPTLTGGTNIDAVTNADGFKYSRNGPIVTVTGKLERDATATGTFDFTISLPVASNFTGTWDATGVGGAFQSSGVDHANIRADTASDTAEVIGVASTASNSTYLVNFQYEIK